MTVEKAREILLTNKTFFAAGLVALGEADGVVSGAVTTSADVIRAGLQVIGPRPGNKTVSSAFILITNTPQYGDEGVLVVGDCGVIPYPTAEQLADVACICVERARKTVQMREPKVAFLSYSTKDPAAAKQLIPFAKPSKSSNSATSTSSSMANSRPMLPSYRKLLNVKLLVLLLQVRLMSSFPEPRCC